MSTMTFRPAPEFHMSMNTQLHTLQPRNFTRLFTLVRSTLHKILQTSVLSGDWLSPDGRLTDTSRAQPTGSQVPVPWARSILSGSEPSQLPMLRRPRYARSKCLGRNLACLLTPALTRPHTEWRRGVSKPRRGLLTVPKQKS